MSKAENLVIMFTDIVGFTERTSMQSRGENEAMLRQNEKLLNSIAKRYGGKRIKSIGDSLLIVYKSPTDAVHSAMAMHDALWEYNQTIQESERLTIRISLNSGEVRIDGGDVFGEPVNVAARLEGMTPANEVYFTEAIYLSMNKAEVSNELVGKYKLRGIPEEVTVYRVPRGAAAHRLIAADNDVVDEDKGRSENEYPFGGVHKREIDERANFRFDGEFPVNKIARAAVAVAAFGAAVMFWPMGSPEAVTTPNQTLPQAQVAPIEVPVAPPVVEVNQEELDLLLESNNPIALSAKLAEILASDPTNANAVFMRGHLSMERREYKDGLVDYASALSKKPELANNKVYAKNLVRAVTSHKTRVSELARLSPTKEVVDHLAKRSTSPGMRGRRNAAQTLRDLDRQDLMDSVAMAILDIKETSDCDEKKKAIGILERSKNARGLEVLTEITSKKKGLGFFKRTCGVKEARSAIKAIDEA